MTSEQILAQAAAMIAERGATYGEARSMMAAIAARWSLTLQHPVTPSQVVLCMIDLKLTRLTHSHLHQDSWVDAAAYAAIGGALASEEE